MDYYDEYVAKCQENIKNFVGQTVCGTYSPKDEPNPGGYKSFSGIFIKFDINNDFPILYVKIEDETILKLGLGRCDKIPGPGEFETPEQCFNELSTLVSNGKDLYKFCDALHINEPTNLTTLEEGGLINVHRT